jgi:putative ABC transport system substrate-binding protein
MAPSKEAFLQGMEALGYVEGRNVRYEFRYAGGDLERIAPLAREVAALNPDVIVATLVVCNRPDVREILSPFPVIVTGVPVPSDCVQDMAQPGGNITGVLASTLTDRTRLELALELLPNATRIGFLLNTASSTEILETVRQAVLAAASDLGIEIVFGEAPGPDEAIAAFQYLVDQRVDAVVFPVLGAPFTAMLPEIVALAATAGMPTVYDRPDPVREGGGLIGIGTDHDLVWRRAAYMVWLVLNGADPALTPVDQIQDLVIAVNVTTAAALGITVPDTILARAEIVR